MAFSTTTRLLNGERAVVLLFIITVFFSLPFTLLFHGLSLSLITLSALFIEIQAEASNSLSQFKTRPGASSGILLGAVTLPAVMLAKLIQLTRAFSSNGVGLAEIESWTMQYWSTLTCCFSVLMLLWNSMHGHGDLKALRSPRIWKLNFGLVCIILYAAVCYISLATLNRNAVHVTLKLSWILCHGLVASKLIQHLLSTFPACASIGESLLVTAGLVPYFGDMLSCTISKMHGTFISPDSVSFHYMMNKSEISPIIQGLLLGLLLCPMVFKCFPISEYSLNIENSEARKHFEIRRSLIFFAILGFIIIVVAPSWMMFVHEFNTHPFLWVISFIFSEPFRRLSLCVYWLSVICASVLRFYNISKSSKIERILLRKYYHLVAVLMFLPALIFQPKFLDLAFGAALAVFLALEIIRVWRIWPLGQPVHQFMNAFTDHRDSELLVVSHFSLLLGCAIPIWMSSGFNDRPLAPFAGILSLGIGDTMASVVGHKYGVLRWSKTGKKTIEGTAAGITSVLAACSILLPLLASTGYLLTEENWKSRNLENSFGLENEYLGEPQLCLMAHSDEENIDDEVCDENPSYDELMSAYDEIKDEFEKLCSKYIVIKKKNSCMSKEFVSLKDEIKSLKIENKSLIDENACLKENACDVKKHDLIDNSNDEEKLALLDKIKFIEHDIFDKNELIISLRENESCLKNELKLAKESIKKMTIDEQKLEKGKFIDESAIASSSKAILDKASSIVQNVMPKHENAKFVPTCHACGIKGHIRPNCHKLKNTSHNYENRKFVPKSNMSNDIVHKVGVSKNVKTKFVPTCHYCGVKGHIRPNCYKLKNAPNNYIKRNFPNRMKFGNRFKRNSHIKKNVHRYYVNENFNGNVTCFKCGKFGHKSYSCKLQKLNGFENGIKMKWIPKVTTNLLGPNKVWVPKIT